MQDKEIIDLFFERSEQAIEETKIKYGTTIRKIKYPGLLATSKIQRNVKMIHT